MRPLAFRTKPIADVLRYKTSTGGDLSLVLPGHCKLFPHEDGNEGVTHEDDNEGVNEPR